MSAANNNNNNNVTGTSGGSSVGNANSGGSSTENKTPTSARPSNAGANSQRQQQYSQADLNKIVLEYLNKKGYHKTESMLRNESASVPLGYNQPLPVSPANTGIPNGQPALMRQQTKQQQQQQQMKQQKQMLKQQQKHQHQQTQTKMAQFKLVKPETPSSEILSEITSQTNNPELYFKGYKILRDWIDLSLDLYKSELGKLLYPIFVNCYIDLIAKDRTELAKQFFDKFKDDHIILHGSEIIEVSAISLVDHLKVSSFIKNFREKKYKVKISSICLYLLLFFLNENKYVGGELVIRIINQYLDFEISNDKLNRFNAVDNLLDPTEGILEFNEKNLEEFNAKKLKLGKFPRDENFDKEIEHELKSKDEKELQKKKPNNAKKTLVDEFHKIKAESSNPTSVEPKSKENEQADKMDIDTKQDEPLGSIMDKLKKNDDNFESPIKEVLPLPAKTIFDLKKEIQLVQDSRSRLKLSFDKNQFSPPSICMYTFHNSLNEITCLEFNENSNLIAAGFEDSYIKLWSIDGNPLKSIVKNDPQNKQNSRRLIGHSGTVYSLSFSPDNNYLLSCSEDGTVRLWSLDTYTTLVVYKSHNAPVWDVKFSPFGHYFVTTSHDSTARLWSVDHIYPLRLFVGHMNDVDCVAWFPNSCYCFTGSADKTIRMWDIMRGDSVRLFVGHTAPINALAVSPQGRILASAGEDAVINLWDIATGRILKTMKGHAVKGSIYSLDFSVDGNVLVSGGSDNSVRVWDVKKYSDNQLSEPVPFFNATSGSLSTESNGSISKNGTAANGKTSLTTTNKNNTDSGRKKTKEAGVCTNDHVGAYFTKHTSVYKVHFTRRNLCLAAGAFSSTENINSGDSALA